MASLLIGDTSEIIVAGVGEILRGGGHRIVAGCFSAREVVRAAAELRPQVLVLGDGLLYERRSDFLSQIKASGSPRIIVLLNDEATYRERLSTINADAFLLMRTSVPSLIACVNAVSTGHSWCDPELSNVSVSPPIPDRWGEVLTAKEREVVYYISRGLPNGAIARNLCTSEGAVKACLQRIHRKLGTRRRSELAISALIAAEPRDLVSNDIHPWYSDIRD